MMQDTSTVLSSERRLRFRASFDSEVFLLSLGVTFLAFANGAPDIFSSYAAITTGKVELGVSALYGAGVFIPIVVLGLVSIVASGAFVLR